MSFEKLKQYNAGRYALDDTPLDKLSAANERLAQIGKQLEAQGLGEHVLPVHRPPTEPATPPRPQRSSS